MFLKISVFSDPRRILEEVIQTRFQEMGLSIARRSIIFEKDLRLRLRTGIVGLVQTQSPISNRKQLTLLRKSENSKPKNRINL